MIISANGLVPIATGLTATTLLDTLTMNGIYYYAVAAENGTGNSSVSNCLNVTASFGPSSNPVGDEWPMFRGSLNHTGVLKLPP